MKSGRLGISDAVSETLLDETSSNGGIDPQMVILRGEMKSSLDPNNLGRPQLPAFTLALYPTNQFILHILLNHVSGKGLFLVQIQHSASASVYLGQIQCKKMRWCSRNDQDLTCGSQTFNSWTHAQPAAPKHAEQRSPTRTLHSRPCQHVTSKCREIGDIGDDPVPPIR